MKTYEDEELLAFPDLHPKAPVHILIVPKKHMAGLPEVSSDDESLLGKIQVLAARLAAEQDVEDAYRVTVNAGRFQEVPHLHYHLLGGAPERGEEH